jgi:hypothetical protein
MLRKYGKFYADWRDLHGKRHRKSFPSAHAAKAFQSKRNAETQAKKVRASAPSATSPRRGSAHGRRKRTTSKSRVISAPPSGT